MEEVKKVPDEETGGGRQNTMKILDKREEAWEEKKSLTDGTGITSFSPKQRSF